ncbi:MAG: hypothetical protein IPG39_17215 [Bacteroidetes bacterium]|nr:hypothetical protein [Bacteroidota bacterium]
MICFSVRWTQAETCFGLNGLLLIQVHLIPVPYHKLNLTPNGNPTVLFNLPVAGAFWSGDSINTRGIYISEFDTAGNLLQVNTISSSNWGLFSYKDYILDNLSNQYVTGYFNSDSVEVGGQTIYNIGTNALNDYDAFVAKFDSAGFT